MNFQGKEDIVKKVQELVGVVADGKPGKKTWTAILDSVSKEEVKPVASQKEVSSQEVPDEYTEVYRESPNQSGTIAPKFIVLHHSSGSHDGSKSWILQDKSNVSYHYLIADDGSRTQFVYDTKKAWHAGKSKYENFVGLNSHSVGISFYGNTHERTPNNLEIDSCAKKCIYLMDKFSIPIERIITHKMCAPGRKDDCSEETYQLVLNRIRQLL